MRAAVLAGALLAIALGAGPASAQPGEPEDPLGSSAGELETGPADRGTGTPDVVDQAGIEGGGHGEHGGHHPAAAPPPVNWYQLHYGKDLHGGTLDPGEEPMAPGVLFAIFNFAVFVGLLVVSAGPKLAAYLRTNHALVKDQLEEAARLRVEARAKLDEYNQRIGGVDAEVNRLLQEIRAEADVEREMILKQARAQADAMAQEAERRIASEIARARAALSREVVGAAMAAAERILTERTTPDDQARLFDGFIAKLTAEGGGNGGDRARRGSVDEEWG